jgi:hypothetical protein
MSDSLIVACEQISTLLRMKNLLRFKSIKQFKSRLFDLLLSLPRKTLETMTYAIR